MKRLSLAFALSGVVLVAAAAQAQSGQSAAQAGGATLDLSRCLEAALSTGDDVKLLERSLAAARSQHAVNVAKSGISLSANGTYSPTYSLDDATLAKTAGASYGLGLAHSVSGGLTLSAGNQSTTNPFTRLSLTATHAIPDSTSASPSSTSLLGLSLAQTLWDGYPGGQTKAAIEKSLISLQGKEITAIQTRSATIAKVKQAYIAMLAAQRTLVLRKSNLDRQNALLKQMKAVYELKQASSVDLQSASINARGAELDVKSAEKDLRLATLRLANLIGRPADQSFVVAELEEPRLPATSLDEAVATGLEKRADAVQLELARKSAAIDLALARGQSQPSIGLSGGFSAALTWGSSMKNGDSANLGLKLSLPVLDAGSSRSQVEASSTQLEIYATQASQLKKTIAADIRDYYESALIQAERVELAKSSMELAQAQFEFVRTQNEFGTATNQDMLTASVTAATAAVAWATARSAWLTAVLQLETAMGL